MPSPFMMGHRVLSQTSCTVRTNTLFWPTNPLMGNLLIARGQKWAFQNPNMIKLSPPTILQFDHLLRFLHSSSNDHFLKLPPTATTTPTYPSTIALPTTPTPPPAAFQKPRHSGQSRKLELCPMSAPHTPPPPMATSYYHLEKVQIKTCNYFQLVQQVLGIASLEIFNLEPFSWRALSIAHSSKDSDRN